MRTDMHERVTVPGVGVKGHAGVGLGMVTGQVGPPSGPE